MPSFHALVLPYLDRLGLGIFLDAQVLTGVAFRDGWLNDVRWLPVSAAAYGIVESYTF